MVLQFMKKLDNFTSCLSILENAAFAVLKDTLVKKLDEAESNWM